LESQLATESHGAPLYRVCLAFTYRALGDLAAARSRAEAEQSYRRALELQTRLVAEFPSVLDYREALADSYNCLGILTGEYHEWQTAESHFRQALAIRARLAADCPTVPRYRQLLANSHANLGTRFERAQDWAAAEQHYHQALEVQASLAKEFPGEPRYRHDLAITHRCLADLFENADDWQKAIAHYRQAVDLQAKLVAELPVVPHYQNELANCEEHLGNLLWATREEHAAQDHFRHACELWTCLTDKEAPDPIAGTALHEFARFLATCPAEPLRDANRAIALARRAIDQAPARGIHWATLGIALYRSGNAHEAIAAQEKACQLRPGADAVDGFFRALANAQLGNREQARQWYDRAA